MESTLAMENLKRRFGREVELSAQLEQESEQMSSASRAAQSPKRSLSRRTLSAAIAPPSRPI